jgi:PAS domain-containing protein
MSGLSTGTSSTTGWSPTPNLPACSASMPPWASQARRSGPSPPPFIPADIERVQEDIQRALNGDGNFISEYRLTVEGQPLRWIVARGQVYFDADGAPEHFPGLAVDITERKQMDANLAEVASALAESEARFRAIADSMPQMVWSTLPDGYHDYYNARWYEFTGVPAGSTDGEGWNGIFHPEDQDRAPGSCGPIAWRPASPMRSSTGCGATTASIAGRWAGPCRSATRPARSPAGSAPAPTSTTPSGWPRNGSWSARS